MKRTTSIFLLAALVFTLCTCGQRMTEAVTVSAAPEPFVPQESPAANQEASTEETSEPETETTSVEVAAPFVYFTADISPEGLQAVYELGKKLK